METKKHYKLTVEPITCVHIGTGEILTPLEYKLHTLQNGKTIYLAYSTDSILRRIAKDEKKAGEFYRISDAGNMNALAQFFNTNVCKEDRTAICDTTREFSRNFAVNAKKDPLENAREVFQMYRNGLNPVIPGSSLKGSIRTAVLNMKMHNLSDRKYDEFYDDFSAIENEKAKARYEDKLQKALLTYSDAKNDPFRAVEIGDCKFDGNGIELVGVLKNVKMRSSGEVEEHNSSQIQAEVLKGSLMNEKVLGTGKIRLNGSICEQINEIISMKDIIESCNYFFLREFEKEYDTFYKNDVEHCDLIFEMRKELQDIKKSENQFIVRIGRWSQVEFVTFEQNFRNPETPKIRGKQMPYGTTRTVFNYDGQYLPLGWCKCMVSEVL